jgi:hypothetical protein
MTQDPYPALLGIDWAFNNNAVLEYEEMKNFL